jgi:hypothetical protein
MLPDPWQTELLRSAVMRMMLLCSRQSGKSTVAGALALREALLQPQRLVLLLSPTLRQSGELFRKVLDVFGSLGRPLGVMAESAHKLELVNGSRIVSLPGTEGTIRGYSGVNLLIIDEASRVDDALYYATRPMLAVSQGRLVVLSTPFGKRGWFFSEWMGGGDWSRIKITADQCPRISPQFLRDEERALGRRWFDQEYMCSFEDTVDQLFSYSLIQSTHDDTIQPLLPLIGMMQ